MSFDPPVTEGEPYTNRRIVEIFKCDNMNGIRPSAATNTIVLITGVAADAPYRDRWEGDHFLYTGMGKHGDQRLSGRNKSLSQHSIDGRSLHVFERESLDHYVYVGEFELDGVPRQEPQPDLNGDSRLVWLFPLQRVAGPSAGQAILSKPMDRSLFRWGTAIPWTSVPIIDRLLGRHVDRGTSVSIDLVVDGRRFEAKIHNVDRTGITHDTYHIRYDSNRALKELLQDRYPEYLASTEKAHEEGLAAGQARPRTDTTHAPQIAFLTTGTLRELEYRLSGSSAVPGQPFGSAGPALDSSPPLSAHDVADVGKRRIRALRDFDPNLDAGRESRAEVRAVQATYAYELHELASKSHSSTLQTLALALLSMGLAPRESNIDLIATCGDDCWLFEVKSIRKKNVRRQTRTALGQLLEYRYFETGELASGGRSEMAVVYSQKPPQEIADFLAANHFRCLWRSTDGSLSGDPASLQALGEFAAVEGVHRPQDPSS